MSSHSQGPPADRLVIGITGRIGSGKTSAGRYLSQRHQFQYLRYSQVLSEWMAKDSESKALLQDVGWKIMAGGMQTELNRRLTAQIAKGTDVAVDGLRHPVDYESLRESFSFSFHLLYIDSLPSTRWTRLRLRGAYEILETFEKADSHAVEQQIESLRANAEVVLHNEGSLEDLYVALDKAILSFKLEGRA